MFKATLLGQFRLSLGDQPLDLASRPAQALLAYLLLNAGIAFRREQLAGLLWPDYAEASARKNLRNAVWQVRRAIGEDYLRVDRDTIAFDDQAPHDLDTARLAQDAHSPEALAAAVAAYQGELLPGFYDNWVVLERERLRALFERRAQALLDQLAAAGQWTEAQTWAEHWIAQGQAPEPAYRVLMLAAAAHGDLAGVASAYRRCVQALRAELEVAPSAETQELYARLSSGALRPAMPASPGTAPSQPSPPPAPEPEPEPAAPDSLPLPPTPFVGREVELADLCRLLRDDPGCRLITILGPGGIGKTRLGLEALAALQSRFRHGACFVPLAPLTAPEHLVSVIGEHLRCQFGPDAPPKQQLLTFLRPRQLLLLLDDFEHLVEGAGLVAEILAAAPQVKILVTSRERLNLTGELVYALGGMAVPGGGPDQRVLDYGAVQLLIQRARLVRPDLQLSAYHLDAIVRICQLVQGMPLAIVLATAWLEVLSFDEIAAELAHSLDFLESQLRDMPARQRSVRATFDYSWQRLPPEAQQAFARVSVFRGGFTREAAQAVAGVERRTLLRLANKSFLSVGARHRYEVHELLRQYGEERLEQAGQTRDLRDRHLAHFLELAETADGHMRGPQQSEWLDRLEAEHDNLRAALHWALDTQQTELSLRLAGTLWWLWDNRGYIGEGRAWAEAALRLPPSAPDEAEARAAPAGPPHFHPPARALLGAGILTWLQSDYAQAKPLLEQSRAVATAAGDRWCQAYATCRLGRVFYRRGDWGDARALAEESLAQFVALGDAWGESRPRRDLGLIALSEGDLAAARDYTQQALAQRREQRDWDGIGDALTILGVVEWVAGNYDQAEALYLEALAICRDLPYKLGIGSALNRLALTLYSQGRFVEAIGYFNEGLAVCNELGNKEGLAYGLIGQALVAAATGAPERAARFLGAMEAALKTPLPYLPSYYQPLYERLVAELEAGLGAARLAELRAADTALSLDEALQLGLAGEAGLSERPARA